MVATRSSHLHTRTWRLVQLSLLPQTPRLGTFIFLFFIAASLKPVLFINLDEFSTIYLNFQLFEL